MAIQFPQSRTEVADRAKADVQSQLAASNPFLKNSFLGALTTGFAGRNYEFYLQLENALLEMFPDTATGSYLERWGSYVAVNRTPATIASGFAILTGNSGGMIPINTTLSSSNGNVYTTTAAVVLTTNQMTVNSLTRSGQVVTVLCDGDHSFATGMSITISGATPAAYNGSYVVTVTAATTFNYTIAGSPTTPATGSIRASVVGLPVPVRSTGYGSVQNLISGDQLTLNVGLAGVDNIAYIGFDGVGGGSDIESDTAYRARVLYRYQNPIALFNVSAITSLMLSIPGVTRVWVREAASATDSVSVSSLTSLNSVGTVVTTSPHGLESGQMVTISGAIPSSYNQSSKCLVIDDTTLIYSVPAGIPTTATGTIILTSSLPAGQVRVFFTRDNDAGGPIPIASQVTAAKNVLLTIKPAHVASADVIVRAPTALAVPFTFTALSPNTLEMRNAIKDSLTALFLDQSAVGVPLNAAAYTAAIWQAVTTTGIQVQSYTLSTPTTTVAVTSGQLPLLGTITWP